MPFLNRVIMESLTGIIERITFHNPDNGFTVLKVAVRGLAVPVTVVGTVMMVTAGEHLIAQGRWTMDRQHGRQFEASVLETTHPKTAEGMERYLASGAVRSVGPKLAARIVALYKERSLDILENYPEMLLHLKGIGPEKLKKIRESWQEQKHVREIMLFLHQHGIGTARANRIYRTYGDKAIEVIRANPYQLADDVRGIGFQSADEVAKILGIDPNSIHRAKAALRYIMQEVTYKQGHAGFPEGQVLAQAEQLVSIGRTILESALAEEIVNGRMVREPHDDDQWLFLARLFRAETSLAESLDGLLSQAGHPMPAIDLDVALSWVQERLSIELAEGQREALRAACRERVVIITGGPGVGKTTLVRSLLEVFEAKKLRCVFAAPTGRAAKRLSETTKRPAKTIHRLLEFDPAISGFKRTRGNPLSGDVFVLDECSMVDVLLAEAFFEAIPQSASVILVGDADQLPSVGPGNVLGDLIRSRRIAVARLTEIFRQVRSSRIVSAAHAVNEGSLPDLEAPSQGLTDFYFTECETPEAVERMIVKLVKERIPERFGLNPLADVQVLTPMNGTSLGARQLNQVLQAALNPKANQKEISRFGVTFRQGDRVIQTENNYQREVYNGDLGTVERIDPLEQELVVRFEGRDVAYDFNSLDELSLAYVLTIHKSQGSEYPCVIIPLHTQHFLMLRKNLLYTALTRGKQLVIVVGSKKALEIAVSRTETAHRHTALADRLRQLER